MVFADLIKNKFMFISIIDIKINKFLEYNLLFYYPHHKESILNLENIQKRFTKRICAKGMIYCQRLELLSDMSIQKSAMVGALVFMYKIIVCGLCIDGFDYRFPHSVTRGSPLKLFLPYCKTN